jgi:hypothetical protein
MKIELVEFKDGTFGVRRKKLFRSYEFVSRNHYWYSENERLTSNAVTAFTQEEAMALFVKASDLGTPV